jgi:hypothetical protein
MQKMPGIQETSTEEPFFINSIFERDSEARYTKKALLYQDFMEFAFVEKHEPIRMRDFAKWIIEKNVEISNHYTGFNARVSMSNKIANHDRTIKKSINNLEKSLLIRKKGTTKAEKNHEIIPLYGYTIDGQIIACIILYNKKPSLRVLARDKILYLIQRYFTAYNSHIVDFVVKLYAKAVQKGFSDSIVVTLSNILHSDKKLKSIVDALNWCLYLHLEGEPHKHAFFNLWVEVLNEFEPEIRNIILYHEKSDIESRIHLYQPPKSWEEIWIRNIHESSKLVLYGVCKNCSEKYPVLVDYYMYRKETVVNEYVRVDCQKCNSKDSLFAYSKLPNSN